VFATPLALLGPSSTSHNIRSWSANKVCLIEGKLDCFPVNTWTFLRLYSLFESGDHEEFNWLWKFLILFGPVKFLWNLKAVFWSGKIFGKFKFCVKFWFKTSYNLYVFHLDLLNSRLAIAGSGQHSTHNSKFGCDLSIIFGYLELCDLSFQTS
jgi:hypothetical protein